MKSIEEIENNLRIAAKSHDLVGDSLEILIKLLAFNQYEVQLATTNALLESNPATASNLNSIISHAGSNMYSVYRGSNPRVQMSITIESPLSLTYLEEVYSTQEFKLYYSRCFTDSGVEIPGDYRFTVGKVYTMEFIVSSSRVIDYLSTSANSSISLESISEGISEDLSLKKLGVNSSALKLTRDFGDHIDSSKYTESESLIFVLTLPGSGVRFYHSNPLGFDASSEYILTYLPYYEGSITKDDLDAFSLNLHTIDRDSITIKERIPVESLESINYNARRTLVTQSRVRTNQDLIDALLSRVPYIRDANIHEFNKDTDELIINYIPIDSYKSDLFSDFQLSSSDVSRYIDSKLYYITDNIVFKPLMDATNSRKLSISLDFKLLSELDFELVVNYISKFEYKLGVTLSIPELVGYVSSFNSVVYCIVKVIDLASGMEIKDSLTVGKDEYLVIQDSLTYSYKY